jgi:hypothetical protein
MHTGLFLYSKRKLEYKTFIWEGYLTQETLLVVGLLMSPQLNEPFNDDMSTAEDVSGQMRSTGMMLTDEGCGMMLNDEGCGMMLTDEECGMMLNNEGCGIMVTDEGCGMMLNDEGCGMMLNNEGCRMMKDVG